MHGQVGMFWRNFDKTQACQRTLAKLPYSSKFLCTIIWWISWFDFRIIKFFLTMAKFSIIVGMSTFCVRTHAHRDHAINVQTLYVYFQKRSKVAYQIHKDITYFVQNFLLVSNPPTIMLKRWPNKMIAEGAKRRKKVQYRSCLISFSSH